MELEKIPELQENLWLKRQRRKRQRLLISEILFDYARNSTLHGLRYITEKRLRTFEKLFWLVTFGVSLAFCSYHIANVYVKWRDSPVIVSVNERLVSADTVPFPSVTICPQIKCKATVYDFTNMTKYMDKPVFQYYYFLLAPHRFYPLGYTIPSDEKQKYDLIASLCKHKRSHFGEPGTSNISIIDVIDEVSPTLDDTLRKCFWKGEEVDCDSIFSKVYTSEGLCFNFNGVAGSELFREPPYNTDSNWATHGWDKNAGYSNYSDDNIYPKRGRINGAEPDFEVLLSTLPDHEDILCNGISSGYKIFLHNPTDMVQSTLHYYSAVHEQVSSLAVGFNILNTSESLKSYKPNVRQCYFPGDRYLQHFKIYSLKNCQAECIANYTYKSCRCAGYYMPRNATVNICLPYDKYCMEQAHLQMTNEELNFEDNYEKDLCRCLPACENIDYEAEILKTNYNRKVYLKTLYKEKYGFIRTLNLTYSKIELYYKNPHFVSMRRSEIFGFTDFVANIGGLLGVFLGFSFLSLVELVYFLTIRIGFSLKRDMKEEKRQKASVKMS